MKVKVYLPAIGTEHSSYRLEQQVPSRLAVRVEQNFCPRKSSKLRWLFEWGGCCWASTASDDVTIRRINSDDRDMVIKLKLKRHRGLNYGSSDTKSANTKSQFIKIPRIKPKPSANCAFAIVWDILKVECSGTVASHLPTPPSRISALFRVLLTQQQWYRAYFRCSHFFVSARPPTHLNSYFFPQRKQIITRSKVIRIQNADAIHRRALCGISRNLLFCVEENFNRKRQQNEFLFFWTFQASETAAIKPDCLSKYLTDSRIN